MKMLLKAVHDLMPYISLCRPSFGVNRAFASSPLRACIHQVGWFGVVLAVKVITGFGDVVDIHPFNGRCVSQFFGSVKIDRKGSGRHKKHRKQE